MRSDDLVESILNQQRYGVTVRCVTHGTYV